MHITFFCFLCQGEVGGPGQKGGKGLKGEHVSVFILPFYTAILLWEK